MASAFPPRPVSAAAIGAAASPLTSIGVRMPRPGTGAIIATSANAIPRCRALAASRCFRSAEDVFRSA